MYSWQQFINNHNCSREPNGLVEATEFVRRIRPFELVVKDQNLLSKQLSSKSSLKNTTDSCLLSSLQMTVHTMAYPCQCSVAGRCTSNCTGCHTNQSGCCTTSNILLLVNLGLRSHHQSFRYKIPHTSRTFDGTGQGSILWSGEAQSERKRQLGAAAILNRDCFSGQCDGIVSQVQSYQSNQRLATLWTAVVITTTNTHHALFPNHIQHNHTHKGPNKAPSYIWDCVVSTEVLGVPTRRGKPTWLELLIILAAEVPPLIPSSGCLQIWLTANMHGWFGVLGTGRTLHLWWFSVRGSENRKKQRVHTGPSPRYWAATLENSKYCKSEYIGSMGILIKPPGLPEILVSLNYQWATVYS